MNKTNVILSYLNEITGHSNWYKIHRKYSGDSQYVGYFGEVDHLIPWQIDHQINWRPVAKNAVEALSKLVNKKYNYR